MKGNIKIAVENATTLALTCFVEETTEDVFKEVYHEEN